VNRTRQKGGSATLSVRSGDGLKEFSGRPGRVPFEFKRDE
jgi:hypothetical protein